MIRDDLSNRLIHLTQGDYADAKATFLKILADGAVQGSSNNVRGRARVICFSEAPISKLGLLLAHPKPDNVRYRPFGVMFEKNYLFEKGARPVIYQPNAEYELLHPTQQFRHVRYEPASGCDWTWEREWRLKADSLELEPDAVTLIIPNRSVEGDMRQQHHWRVQTASFVTEFGATVVGEYPWHFIVLEDLGVEIPQE